MGGGGRALADAAVDIALLYLTYTPKPVVTESPRVGVGLKGCRSGAFSSVQAVGMTPLSRHRCGRRTFSEVMASQTEAGQTPKEMALPISSYPIAPEARQTRASCRAEDCLAYTGFGSCLEKKKKIELGTHHTHMLDSSHRPSHSGAATGVMLL